MAFDCFIFAKKKTGPDSLFYNEMLVLIPKLSPQYHFLYLSRFMQIYSKHALYDLSIDIFIYTYNMLHGYTNILESRSYIGCSTSIISRSEIKCPSYVLFVIIKK